MLYALTIWINICCRQANWQTKSRHQLISRVWNLSGNLSRFSRFFGFGVWWISLFDNRLSFFIAALVVDQYISSLFSNNGVMSKVHLEVEKVFDCPIFCYFLDTAFPRWIGRLKQYAAGSPQYISYSPAMMTHHNTRKKMEWNNFSRFFSLYKKIGENRRKKKRNRLQSKYEAKHFPYFWAPVKRKKGKNVGDYWRK